MFEALTKYRCVIVTGPHRSGTTLCAHAVALDTGLFYVDEEDYACDLSAWRRVVEAGRGVVVHSPGMARWLHEVAGREDVFAIWMRRPLAQTMVSESRLGWSEKAEREKYVGLPEYIKMRQYPVSVIKTAYWRNVQQAQVRHSREVDYDELKAHPLWLPAEKRRNFTPRQWAVRELVVE